MMKNGKHLTLEVITPAGRVACVECDSVHLTLSDDRRGHGKGSYGIRTGHADAVLLLTDGEALAREHDQDILRVQTGKGFATVRNNVVSVVVDRAERAEARG